MSAAEGRPLVERAALAIQDLYRDRGRGWNTLLRIDNREEEETAPYRFDAVRGVLHRRECRAITEDARSACYAVWRVDPDDRARKCGRCMPMSEETARGEQPPEAKAGPDVLFGLVSILDQFGGVLQERGKDYRKTEEGRKISAELGRLYQALGRREKEILDTALSSLEQLIGRLRGAEDQVKGGR